ncbi:MAG: FHA domain-containing protein [Clostridia bacterium]|nr:FHA domain-containing protein [Clostridia bacterium]MBN2883733.1 FHA domain-containing protein [Clostridia bacterium]
MIAENTIIQGKNFLRASGARNDPGYIQRMIISCKPSCLIKFEIFNGTAGEQVLYRTDSYVRLSEYLSKNGMDRELFRQILKWVSETIKECTEYLLPPERLVMESDLIYIDADRIELKFIFSLFESRELRQSMKNLFTSILGNYYSGYGINDERFREWAAREISKNDFTASRMLAVWEYSNEPDKPVNWELHFVKEQPKKITFIKNLLEKTFESKEKDNHETMPISQKTEGMFLTGICSIDTKIPVADEGVTIGRQMLKQDYGLFNSGIGKAHARLYKMDGSVYITDMGSRNGTYLNGDRLEKQSPRRIERGDIVSFSDEEFILC